MVDVHHNAILRRRPTRLAPPTLFSKHPISQLFPSKAGVEPLAPTPPRLRTGSTRIPFSPLGGMVFGNFVD
jgi:hypothetical protein